jgi:hypothetical protein
VRIASGDIASALDDIPPRGESFDYLAGQLLYDGRLADLESLIAAYRREAPESAAGLRWQAELLWQRQDYEGIIESLAPWSPETARELDDWERSGLAEKLVRSYLRLNRTTQARQAAKTVYDLAYPCR